MVLTENEDERVLCEALKNSKIIIDLSKCEL